VTAGQGEASKGQEEVVDDGYCEDQSNEIKHANKGGTRNGKETKK